MNAFQTQLRVIFALTLREINAQQQTLMYGYAWALVDVVLTIGGLLVMKLAIRAFNPAGMAPATFIVTGIIPWYIFHHGYSIPYSALARNKRLLTFPIVTELDIIVAAGLQLLLTYGIIFVVASVVASALENSPPPPQPLAVMLLVLSSWLCGILFGCVLLPLRRLYDPIDKFLHFFLRFGMILSGVFVPITFFPEYIWPYLSWNPMLHVAELIHTYWFSVYHTPIGSSSYLMESLLGLTVVGLLCERYVRWRLPEA